MTVMFHPASWDEAAMQVDGVEGILEEGAGPLTGISVPQSGSLADAAVTAPTAGISMQVRQVVSWLGVVASDESDRLRRTAQNYRWAEEVNLQLAEEIGP